MTADNIYIWANWTLVGALVLGVLSTYAIVASGNIRDSELKRELKEKDKSIATANARALEAQLALEKLKQLKQPRNITKDGQVRISSKIKSYSGILFDIAATTSKESLALVEQIEKILILADWKQLEWTGGSISRNGKPTIGHAIETGVSIQVEFSQEKQLLGIAKALASALNEEGITAREEFMPKPKTKNHNAIHIIIGDKPL
ncbi:MAG: hypothetical protein GY714_17250 [Desulfobacterales bacterium]|nr:hypothetical protein [Desulfobacterales bacterium]